MYISQEDIRDFFYRLAIPDSWSPYFGLPEVDLNLLASLYVDSGDIIPSEVQQHLGQYTSMNPEMVVLPMGCSWAFHLSQLAHDQIAMGAIPETGRIVDRSPPPPLSIHHSSLLLYADNANHISLAAATSNESRIRLSEALNRLQLSTHETEEATTRGRTLGVSFDGELGVLAATPERDSNLDQALSAIISGHPINANDMQRVVGHLTCRMLLCRPLLSCLKSLYSYINAGVICRRAVWLSVRSELQTIQGLLVFAFADLHSPFSTTVTMTDACLSGYGVVGCSVIVAVITCCYECCDFFFFFDLPINKNFYVWMI